MLQSRQQGKDSSRGEVWMMTHKKIDGSYIHQDAHAISHDESSQNDSLGQVVGKKHPDRVHGMGFGPIPSQLFDQNSQQTGEGAQAQETQRVLEELQVELMAEKLKR
ncbi:hypothetical protein PIB30_070182 [Stylosanthes scabra]|uniref:Uncharacterized protein n=1 Tax=Stylosanthes scabra TaxID=79078 RepID=A0ABU6YR33_9FABA|nr:hypothetical protein [Stylosanthes scabra]